MIPGQVLWRIAPTVLAVFVCFVGIGATISVIPLYVSEGMGLSSTVVGLVVASQYLSMLLARPTAGSCVDSRGPKAALQRGAVFFLLCGIGYLWSAMAAAVAVKLTVLVGARLLLGIAESYIVTGALAWAIRHVGAHHSGVVMSWNGNAMYGGIAVGAPLVGLLGPAGGLVPVAWLSVLLGGIGASIIFLLRPYAPTGGVRAPFHRALRLIAQPGTGLLLASVGYGTILGFVNLLFQHNGWSTQLSAISGFGLAYVVVRVFFGGLPDKYGGVRIAFWSLIIESVGQALLYSAANEYVALLGSVFSGAGFSLVVPAFGVEAVRRVPPESRGAAVAGYLVFFDLAFGVAIPFAGVLADVYAIRVVYLFGLVCSLAGLLLAARMVPAVGLPVLAKEAPDSVNE